MLLFLELFFFVSSLALLADLMFGNFYEISNDRKRIVDIKIQTEIQSLSKLGLKN